MSRTPSGASRRDFLKLAGGALGGVMLGGAAGCGGSGSVIASGGGGVGDPLPGTPLPNGYVFYRLYTPTRDTSYFPDLQNLSGGVMNNDAMVMFHGTRATAQNAYYSLQIQYNGTDRPTITDSAILVSEGDTQSGFPIQKLSSGAVNNGGAFGATFASTAISAETTGNPFGTVASNAGTPVVLLSAYGQPYARVAGHYDPIPGGGNLGAHIGDVAVDEDNNVMFTADFSRKTSQGLALSQGLFYVPSGQPLESGQLLLQTAPVGSGDLSLPSRFGRLDLDAGGRYLVQSFGPDPSGLRDARGGPAMRAGILAGRPGHEPELLAGTLGRRRGRVAAGGNVYFAPRLRGNVASVLTHTSDTSMTLNVGGANLAATGGTSPNGNTIVSLLPASVSGNGLAHYLLTHANGMELVVSNGSAQKTILEYNDPVDGAPIQGIVHGFHSDQSDSQGRIVLVGEFADGSQSVIVGIPI